MMTMRFMSVSLAGSEKGRDGVRLMRDSTGRCLRISPALEVAGKDRGATPVVVEHDGLLRPGFIDTAAGTLTVHRDLPRTARMAHQLACEAAIMKDDADRWGAPFPAAIATCARALVDRILGTNTALPASLPTAAAQTTPAAGHDTSASAAL